MQTDELIYNVTGQVVELYPPEWPEGVPSSASASVYEGSDDNDETAEFSPSVSVDSVDTTVDAASGYSQANKHILYLTATTSIAVGRKYLATTALGQTELVKVTAISSGAHVLVQEPLKYDYAVGSTFKGIRMTWTVDATWVATEDRILSSGDAPYRVIWAYTVNSLARRFYTYLRLVRQPWTHAIDIYKLAERLPDVGLSEPEGYVGQQLRYAIGAAEDAVRADLLTYDLKPDMLRDTELVAQLLILKAIQFTANWHTPNGRDKESWSMQVREDYERFFSRVATGAVKIPVDTEATGGITSNTHEKLWFGR